MVVLGGKECPVLWLCVVAERKCFDQTTDNSVLLLSCENFVTPICCF